MKSEEFTETEEGLIPKDWQMLELGDVCSSISDTYDLSKKDKIIFLNTGDILNGKILNRNISEVKKLPGQAKKKIAKNDILFSEIRPANKRFAFIDFDADEYVVSTKLMVLRSDNKIFPKFLFHFITSPLILNYFQGLAESRSGTFPQITFDTIKNIPLRLPNMNEQKKIVSYIESIVDKIHLNNQMNQTLEAIGQSIFRHWFVHYEFPDENGQPYKSGGGEMIDSELGEIPIEWNVVENIAEECDLINYGYTQRASEEMVGPKFLRVMDINKGDWINWDTVPYCEIDKEQLAKYRLERGDIVIARMADPGKVAIFESNIDAVFASYLIRIRLLDPKYSYYFYYLMKSPYYQYYIVGASSGTVQSNLNAKGLTRGLSVIIPDLDTINSFNMIISLLRKKINENIAETQNLSQIRNFLLPKLMSGKIRVKHIEEATAK